MQDVPCLPEHLASIQAQEYQLSQVGGSVVDSKVLYTHARALIHEDVVLACFGVAPLWSGVWQAWSLLSEDVLTKHPICLSRHVKHWLEQIEREEGMHRVQAAVADGHRSAHRWISWLGFQREGLMHNYGLEGHGDFYLYARVH